MTFPYEKMRAAVAGGLSIVCATCARYWEGRAAELPDPGCTAAGPCSGPLGGGSFERYDGPITDFTRWCFKCGADATAAVRVAGTEKSFGVCAGCSDHVVRLSPVGHVTHHLIEVVKPTGVVLVDTVRRARPSTRRSLGAVLAEVETELSERAEKRR